MIPQSSDSSNSTPIEFNRRTNSVNTRSKNHDSVIVEIDIVLGSIVGGVQVVGVTREFSGDGIDLLDPRGDTSFNSKSSDSQLVGVESFGDLSIRESETLGISDKLNRDRV